MIASHVYIACPIYLRDPPRKQQAQYYSHNALRRAKIIRIANRSPMTRQNWSPWQRKTKYLTASFGGWEQVVVKLP